MAKPDTLPEWDTNEVNLEEADSDHKLTGWVFTDGVPEPPPADFSNWYQNLVYKWILHLSQSKVYTAYITTQAEFDAFFDGVGTITDSTIYLLQGTYTLNNAIDIGSNVLIDSDPGTVVTRGSGTVQFSLIGTALSYIENVNFTRNWTLDGDSIPTSLSMVNLDYVKNSIFHCNITNVIKNTGIGAAYNDLTGFCFGLSIENISNCQATEVAVGNGGGIFGISKSFTISSPPEYGNIIRNIYNCSAENGGGASNINFSVIENIYSCSGAGVFNVTYCDVKNIYNNTGGGISIALHCIIDQIHGNTNNLSGGGVIVATDCTISNISENTSTTGSGAGVYNVDNCKITQVYNNNSATAGAGVDQCNDCTITDVYNNAATAGAGGADSCLRSTFLGNWQGNTGTGANVTITNSSGITFLIRNTTTAEISTIFDDPINI